jgi:hypothetical protein
MQSDPLSVKDDEIRRADREAKSARYSDRPPGDTAALEAELATAEPSLHILQRIVREGGAASTEARRRIARPSGLLEVIDERCLQDEDHGPVPWLDRIQKAAVTGNTREAANQLKLWHAAMDVWIADATRIADANDAPSRERDELRQLLLDLEAKAGAKGLASDEGLVACLAAADASLKAIPTDLAEARAKVHEYGALIAMRT